MSLGMAIGAVLILKIVVVRYFRRLVFGFEKNMVDTLVVDVRCVLLNECRSAP